MTVQDAYQVPAGEDDGADHAAASADPRDPPGLPEPPDLRDVPEHDGPARELPERDDRWGRRERHAMTVLRSSDPGRVSVHARITLSPSDDQPDADEAARWDRRGHLANLSRVAKEVQIVFDPSGAVRFVDNEIRWALGYQPHEFVARFGPEFVHPEDLLVHQDAWSIASKAFGARSRAEFRLRHADGTWRSFEASYQNLVNDPMTGGIGLHLRDVTDRRSAQEALQASEERFRQLAENIDEVFWMNDPASGSLLYVSPGYERICQRSVEALYRNPRLWLEAVHPDDRERVRIAARERLVAGGYNEEYRVLRPDLSLIHI